MKRLIKSCSYILLAVVLVNILSLQACKPDKPEGQTPQEQALALRIDPTPANPVRTLGATYDFTVVFTSALPAQGVKLNVTYTRDSNGSQVFSQEYNNIRVAQQGVTITNIPFNEIGTVTVTATSLATASNTATASFKLLRK